MLRCFSNSIFLYILYRLKAVYCSLSHLKRVKLFTSVNPGFCNLHRGEHYGMGNKLQLQCAVFFLYWIFSSPGLMCCFVHLSTEKHKVWNYTWGGKTLLCLRLRLSTLQTALQKSYQKTNNVGLKYHCCRCRATWFQEERFNPVTQLHWEFCCQGGRGNRVNLQARACLFHKESNFQLYPGARLLSSYKTMGSKSGDEEDYCIVTLFSGTHGTSAGKAVGELSWQNSIQHYQESWPMMCFDHSFELLETLRDFIPHRQKIKYCLWLFCKKYSNQFQRIKKELSLVVYLLQWALLYHFGLVLIRLSHWTSKDPSPAPHTSTQQNVPIL